MIVHEPCANQIGLRRLTPGFPISADEPLKRHSGHLVNLSVSRIFHWLQQEITTCPPHYAASLRCWALRDKAAKYC